MSHSTKQDKFFFPSVEQSFLIITMLAIKADIFFSPSEKEVIKNSLLSMELFQDYSEQQLIQALKKALLRIEIKGEEAVLNSRGAKKAEGRGQRRDAPI